MTPDEFTKRCAALPKTLHETENATVIRIGAEVAAAVNASITADTGGDQRLSGVKSSKLIFVTPKPTTIVGKPAVLISGGRGIKGLLAIMERGAKDHVIGAGKNAGLSQTIGGQFVRTRTSKKGKTSTRTVKPKILATPYGPRTGPFFVRGSKAKHTFSRAVNTIAPTIPQRVAADVKRGIITTLGGAK